MSEEFCIYALLDEKGCVLYVGQTSNLKRRFQSHRSLRTEFRGAKCKKLRDVPFKDRLRIEKQVIASYKRRGQCSMNRSAGRPRIYDEPTIHFMMRVEPEVFRRFLAVKKQLGVSYPNVLVKLMDNWDEIERRKTSVS